MVDKILLNNKEYHFNDGNFPCLVNYSEKTGGSHFSVTMVADLFLRGHKILVLTAYPMAKDNFFEQIAGHESLATYTTGEDKLDSKFQAIILESGNEELYLSALDRLEDINERIILIKNIEVFSKEVIDRSLGLNNLILSGNVDLCANRDLIIRVNFSTIILFTKPEIALPFEIPHLEKYIGYFWNKKIQGLVNISSDRF